MSTYGIDPADTPASDFPPFVALIMKAETDGLDSFEECCQYAQALVSTGLVNSTGTMQRFVRDMVAAGWHPVDSHGNYVAEEGVTLCACGCKYWEHDRCTDCGTVAYDDILQGDD
jgi:hypothetical protein